ncbi:hypothetical protein [Neobacillus sp. SuZ13]|uniref:hypothetical protein n=1 Tax=Neobacillus sp. SuZ13 TaxID=3047875 RepID=UPI0024BF549F|nr:hypothetical protein [Neobacillus sp. SuZ13]WHY64662.1 hypothetical protein QNH17_16170 [Neobacillus sp. SuZ13]
MKNRKTIKYKERPLCTVTLLNEPNFELMAKAFQNLYYQNQNNKFLGNGNNNGQR